MAASTMTYAMILIVGSAGQYSRYSTIRENEAKEQKESFQRLWNDELVWKFDDLPDKASVPEYRVPYSGCIYLNGAGGTASSLSKYDRAFYGGRSLTASYERNQIYRQQTTISTSRRGLFGFGRTTRTVGTPHWYGHCNGWTAASIRHAEPEHSVTRNGVTFTPADIKGLLAELYMWCDTEYLSGYDADINPGTLHVVLTNWVGRKQHPIGMEADPGKEVWNYPIYSYAYSSAKRSNGTQVEVKLNARYANSINRESNTPVRNYKTKYFHYVLNLDHAGKVTGGEYFRDSNRIDLLWQPLRPYQGGTEHNERGNPHLKMEDVIALWKESVSEEVLAKWVNIDPIEPRTEAQPEVEALVSVEGSEDAPPITDAETSEPAPTNEASTLSDASMMEAAVAAE